MIAMIKLLYPTKIGGYRGFLAYLNKAVPNVFAVHCVIHHHHLVAKKLSKRPNRALYEIMSLKQSTKSEAIH